MIGLGTVIDSCWGQRMIGAGDRAAGRSQRRLGQFDGWASDLVITFFRIVPIGSRLTIRADDNDDVTERLL